MPGAVRYAVANGAHDAVATWNGGATIPSAGDTVYLNNRTVTGYTSDFDLTTGAPDVNAPSLVAGVFYVIKTVGSTTWTSIGSPNNTVGTGFFATGSGTGSGVATAVGCITNRSLASPAILVGGTFQCGDGRTLKATCYGPDSGVVYPVQYTGYTSTTITGNIYPTIAAGTVRGLGGYGTLTVNGDIKGQQAPYTVGGQGLTCTGSGLSIVLNGNIEAIPAAATGGVGLNMIDCYNLTINGTITGGAGSNSCIGAQINARGTVTIMGPLSGGVPTAPVITGGSGGFTSYGVAFSGSSCICSATIGSQALPGTVTGGSASGAHGIVTTTNASPDITVWANVVAGTAGAGVNITSPGSKFTLNGNTTSNTGQHGVAISNSGTPVVINGNVTGSATSTGRGLDLASGVNITVNGNITGGAFAGSYGLYETGSYFITVNGDVRGGAGSNSYGIQVTGAMSVFVINGTCYATNTTGVGANGFNMTTGATAYIMKAVGCNFGPSNPSIVQNYAALTVTTTNGKLFVRKTQQGTGGFPAVSGNVLRWADNTTYTDEDSLYTSGGSNYATLKHRFGDAVYVPPASNKVRAGSTFAFGDMTGTLNVPNVNSVRKAVSVDASTGVAYVSAADIWNLPNTTAPSADSLLSVISAAATPETAASLTVSFNT